MYIKNYIFYVLFLLTFNGAVYFMSEQNLLNTKNAALENKLDILSTHYKILLDTQAKFADTAYALTVRNEKIIAILKEAIIATPQRQNELREQFHDLIVLDYAIFEKEGISQIHFTFPNNHSFYRVRKPSKFGDDLTGIRKDFEYTNRTKKIYRGFVQGKTDYAFRNTYPIFDKNHNHIGAMEVSFASDSFQTYLNHLSGIHSHFLINENIFGKKVWEREDFISNHLQSAENKEYMLALGDIHTKKTCVKDNSLRLAPYSKEIATKMSKGKSFGILLEASDFFKEPQVASFLSLNNNSNDNASAYIVSYVEIKALSLALKNFVYIRIVMFFVSLLILYFIVRQLKSQEKLKQLMIQEQENEKINQLQQQQIFEQTKHAQMGEMIGNIAHQWRQPLSLISTSASAILIKKEYGILESKNEDEMLETIIQTAQHLSTTINIFRDYLKETKELQEVILQEKINSAIDIVKASLENHFIKIINEIDTIPPIKITMIATELGEVVINILNNAKDVMVSYETEEPFVKITLEKNDTDAVITISDNGGGIPQAVLPKIFDPYFTTKHKSQGTGLGLYMSKEIIEKHLGGKLEAFNNNLGAVFKITLPL